jgi:hypothetical protein
MLNDESDKTTRLFHSAFIFTIQHFFIGLSRKHETSGRLWTRRYVPYRVPNERSSMSRGTVYKSISVRRSPVPRSRSSSGSFFGMLGKLTAASSRLEKARKRR